MFTSQRKFKKKNYTGVMVFWKLQRLLLGGFLNIHAFVPTNHIRISDTYLFSILETGRHPFTLILSLPQSHDMFPKHILYLGGLPTYI